MKKCAYTKHIELTESEEDILSKEKPTKVYKSSKSKKPAASDEKQNPEANSILQFLQQQVFSQLLCLVVQYGA